MVDNHHDHWSNRPWIYWVVLGIVGVFLASFKTDWGWVTPAWVQTIGIFIALAIAIYVPSRIHWREVKERADDQRRQGQGIALLIRYTLRPLAVEMLKAVHKIREGNLAVITIDVPPLLQEQVSRLWLMGRAGEQILHLVSKIDANKGLMEGTNRMFDEVRPLLEAVAPKDIVKFLNMEEEFLESSPEITNDLLKAFVKNRRMEMAFLESARKEIREILEAIERLLENKP